MGLFDLKNVHDFFYTYIFINLVSGQFENFYIKKMVVAIWKTQASLHREALIWQDEALKKKRAKVIIVELWHHSSEQFFIEPGQSLLNMCQARKPCQR